MRVLVFILLVALLYSQDLSVTLNTYSINGTDLYLDYTVSENDGFDITTDYWTKIWLDDGNGNTYVLNNEPYTLLTGNGLPHQGGTSFTIKVTYFLDAINVPNGNFIGYIHVDSNDDILEANEDDNIATFNITVGIKDEIVKKLYAIQLGNEINVVYELRELGNNKVELFNLLGNKLYEVPIKSVKGVIKIDTSNLAKGIYVLRVAGERGVLLYRKVVVQ